MTTLTTIDPNQLATVTGGIDPAQAGKDAARMGADVADTVMGNKPIRQTVDGAISGGQKGYNLPAKNGWERAVNTIGGAAIDAFGLGW